MTTRQFGACLLCAVLLVLPLGSLAHAKGDPPKPPSPPLPPIPTPPLPPIPDPCQKIPNPIYEGCKAEVGCATGPVGNTYCKISGMSFCNKVFDARKNAEDLIRMGLGAAVCTAIMPSCKPIMVMNMTQAAAACAVSSATDANKEKAKDDFCNALGNLPDKVCPGPKTINTCPWKN